MTHSVNRLEEMLDMPTIHYRYLRGKPICGLEGMIAPRHLLRESKKVTCIECMRAMLVHTNEALGHIALPFRTRGGLWKRRQMLLRKLK